MRFLDCSDEVTPYRSVTDQPANWLASTIQSEDWLVPVSDAANAEIRALADYLWRHPAELMQRRVEDFPLPACTAAMQRVRGNVCEGVGFSVLDRLPIEEFPIEVMLEVYWLLGQIMGRPVAQKYSGQMVYHVHDSGKSFQYGVRGSHTNIELNFHTDNAFGRRVPDVVGLLCQRAAASGGISRFCSLYAVHDRIAKVSPAALERLYQPMLFDRQKEHGPDEAPVTLAPFFSWRGDKLFARANPSLIRKGYDVAGQDPDQALVDALDIVDAVSSEPDLWFEAALAPGHMQFLNNHEIGHYRSRFSDAENPEKRRSLYRLWYREEGAVGYHGDPFPAS